jgi:hypothetical protein
MLLSLSLSFLKKRRKQGIQIITLRNVHGVAERWGG